MFNLLPENLKDKIKSEYRARRFIIILFFIISLQATFLVFLFPSWFISFSREKTSISRSDQANAYFAILDSTNVVSLVKSINTRLRIIDNELSYVKATPYINVVISEKPSSLKINKLSFIATSATSSTLFIGGNSVSRESLVLFVKSLQDSKMFNTVDLPISNLAKDKNIDFTVNLSFQI